MTVFSRARKALAWAAAVVAALAADGAAIAQECVFYEHAGYRGAKVSIYSRQEVPRLAARWRDRISSVRVASGCEVRLYDRTNFKGEGVAFTRSTRYVGARWNDQADSISCRCGRRAAQKRDDGPSASIRFGDVWAGVGQAPRATRRGAACIAFDQEKFRGGWRAFREGDRDKRFGQRLSGRVSSVAVAPGCVAVIDAGRPWKFWIDQNLPQLGRGFDDRARAMSCYCLR